MSRTIETMLSLDEARSRILALAEPEVGIEVSLLDALGLILAEPAVADVDHPPFDRSAIEGYAVRSDEATAKTLLRVAGLRWSVQPGDAPVDSGEAIRLALGDALPIGADAVIPLESVKPDPEDGAARVIEVLSGIEPGTNVARRGQILEAGSVLVPAGTRLQPSMVGLMASQGCLHPICHRRVRVAILAVGDHLVGPLEPPVMHRERNSSNASVVALALEARAMPHDLQSVPESQFDRALDRATSSPVIVILGPPSRAISRGLRSAGFELIAPSIALRPGGRSRFGVIRDDSGQVVHHVFHLPLPPLAASVAFTLLVRPLIARLQGDLTGGPRTIAAVYEGTHRPTGDRLRAITSTFEIGEDARARVRPSPTQGPDDLPALARADGLALLPPHAGPWSGGEIVDFMPFE